MQLYLVKNLKSENYLKEEDVVYLVLSNFSFKNIDSKKTRKQFKIKIQKQVLIQFVYYFFNELDINHYKNKIDEYCKFLTENFDLFKNSNQKVLKTNMAKIATCYYPFKTKFN